MLLSIALLALGGCADFVLDGSADRQRPDADGRVIVIVGEDAGPPASDGAPGRDQGASPKADTSAPRPDTSAPKPDTSAPKPDIAGPPGTCGDAYETEVFNLVNIERANQGRAPLLCAVDAGAVARAYSRYMCEARFFSHTGLDGSSPSSRLRDAGVPFYGAGENIAAGQKTPTAVMASWMKSPGHRANILSGGYTHLGVGYHRCVGGKYSAYWTQNFLRR